MAPFPEVAGSTASPGMKWSAPLVTSSIGIRAGSLQVTPLLDFENTMSFEPQCGRKRQSCHAT